MSEEDDCVLWPAGDAHINRQRALLLWSLAREASSPTTRAEFHRLALLYERLAERAPRVQPKLGTLGELLSEKRIKRGRFEVEWVEWLQGTARGDRRAFQTLYLWSWRFVFSLMKAITKDQSAAEEATEIVFQDVWERAAAYDATEDTVISWIMNHARSRALDGKSFSHNGRRRSQRCASGSGGSKQEGLDAIREVRKWQKPSSVTVIENEPDLNEPGPGISCKVLA
ncbi:MAG: hypothetical protein JO339_10765, partial [Alphaproteobacteria bacterium]|nr:hypothetical protein [Alphaproteobacteria bacterium]